jgi:hypothetical protein
VLLFQHAGWALLEDGGELYLDVNCNQSMVGFDITVRLDPAERAAFAESGRPFVAELAEQIAYTPWEYRPRNLTGSPLNHQITEAILAHKREIGDGPGAD